MRLRDVHFPSDQNQTQTDEKRSPGKWQRRQFEFLSIIRLDKYYLNISLCCLPNNIKIYLKKIQRTFAIVLRVE